MGTSKSAFPRRLRPQNRDSTWANLGNALKCRCRVILLVAEGMPITTIAATVGISRRFVYKWVQRFLEQGVEGLANTSKRGPRRVLPTPALAVSQAVST
jgi:Winged helix-turn helix